MIVLSELVKETLKYQSVITDLLEGDIADQEALILAMMFRLGGYSGINTLTEILRIAQPTVSNKVADLVKKGYLRKNVELMPMALVLLLTIEDLKTKLEMRMNKQRNASQFLREVVDIQDKSLVKDRFSKAIEVLYPSNEFLAQMISQTYLDGVLSKTELLKKVIFEDHDSPQLKQKNEELLDSHPEIFEVVVSKKRGENVFIQPRLPLDLFIKTRQNYLESVYLYHKELLDELENYVNQPYEAVIPHQFFQYYSELKTKINTCLRYYSSIRLIDNSVYRKKGKIVDLLNLILDNEHFSEKHTVKILSMNVEKHSIPNISDSSQIEIQHFKKHPDHDYKNRDFIIFEDFGCLVFPRTHLRTPYYTIVPRFVTSVLNFFNANWRINNAF